MVLGKTRFGGFFFAPRKAQSPCRNCRRLRSFDLVFLNQDLDQKIAACGSSYMGHALRGDQLAQDVMQNSA